MKRIHRTGYILPGDGNPVLAGLILEIMNEARYKKPYYKESIRGLLRAGMVELLRLSDDEKRIMRSRTNTAMIAGALDYVADHSAEEIRIKRLAKAYSNNNIKAL